MATTSLRYIRDSDPYLERDKDKLYPVHTASYPIPVLNGNASLTIVGTPHNQHVERQPIHVLGQHEPVGWIDTQGAIVYTAPPAMDHIEITYSFDKDPYLEHIK